MFSVVVFIFLTRTLLTIKGLPSGDNSQHQLPFGLEVLALVVDILVLLSSFFNESSSGLILTLLPQSLL